MTLQQTLAGPFTVEGIGLHTGIEARAVVSPQPENAGLRFRLGASGPEFPATTDYVVETRLATVLGSGGKTVSTVEHILSALLALGVDNALVEVEGPEIPILDGSSLPFVEAIERAGLRAQSAAARVMRLERPHVFRDGEAVLALIPGPAFRVRMGVDFAPPVGAQAYDAAIAALGYARDVAPARTFGYLKDVEALRRAGHALGGSLDNAVVFDDEGPLRPLRLPDEVVRHKVLDLIGDFALLGARPQFEVLAFKSGHGLHAQAVAALRGEEAGVTVFRA
ncbi:MAG: UDP-3-O-[3-hydroxymyristoyl] N-acetylglucosamine deacetylase [Candidatus Eremiobacteraeota bacterium]|nr:UDP-3-O-[3-hydroxymyristoyl] N-acetylglucosamine deacetylase [Candidatus Eremiobacteraeota bacterium]MBC5810187.1 UDP-3-O-[3-hydroxymyristoyl] N-acetylglucosamine deacetylase [Candidatus Eremiobacteraeota bacterium]